MYGCGEVSSALSLVNVCLTTELGIMQLHPVFRVSRLKEKLGDNVRDLSFVPHEPELIVDFRMRKLRNKLIDEYNIKWRTQHERH